MIDVHAKLSRHRDRRMAELKTARRHHRGVAEATHRARTATTALMRFEVAKRKKNAAKQRLRPDLFEKAAS